MRHAHTARIVARSVSFAILASVAAVAACMGRSALDSLGVSDGATTPFAQDGEGGALSDASNGTSTPTDEAGVVTRTACSGVGGSQQPAGPTPPEVPALDVASGFQIESLASVPGARELVALPNGDLLVATNSSDGDYAIWIVPNAEAPEGTMAGAPTLFAKVDDTPAQGVAFAASTCTIYIAAQHGVYAVPYVDAQQSAPSIGQPIAHVRSGPIADSGPGQPDVHTTTSVAVGGATAYVGVGSSCNACVEVDPTRATIQRMDLNGANMATRATRVRNAIALAINPATSTLWAGGAGQDDLPSGHPYEWFDAVGSHAGVADYGWPDCEENHVAYKQGADCSRTIAPLVVLPAYSTIIGAAFYPTGQTGAYVFPKSYRGGVFLTAHGSWHTTNGTYAAAPRVAYVPMDGDTPRTRVDWSDPTKQWSEFVGGFQLSDGVTRIARPTGIAVGVQGSVFVADDQNGLVYRIRPTQPN